ncbi:MAG: hypothetical protein RMN25_04175 [Anaerolineae bacterium]|nr:hypothetical protein [Thermoflexales bacterium]MDW8406960.1 hypothetical protein [Anaerolineae bacterium]
MNVKLNRGVSIITALLAGVAIGLFGGLYIYYAWMPPNIVLRDSPPQFLAVGNEFPQYREVYIARVANRFNAHSDPALGLQEAFDLLGVTTGDIELKDAHEMVRVAAEVANRDLQRDPALRRFTENDQLAMVALERALQAALDTNAGPKNIQPGLPAQVRNQSRLIGGILWLLVAVVAGGVVYLVDQRVGRLTVSAQRDAASAGPPAASYTDQPASQPAPAARQAPVLHPPPPTVVSAGEVPLVSFPPCTYVHGDDQFDEDFAISGAMGELIGECGASIADRLGLDMPARVSALAVWVFDKNDFQSTTKVLMSEYAYGEPAIRGKLAARGEPVLAQNNGVIEVLTSTLRVLIQVSGLQYNTDNNPPNGYFERVTLNFTVYRRQST